MSTKRTILRETPVGMASVGTEASFIMAEKRSEEHRMTANSLVRVVLQGSNHLPHVAVHAPLSSWDCSSCTNLSSRHRPVRRISAVPRALVRANPCPRPAHHAGAVAPPEPQCPSRPRPPSLF